MCGFTSDQQAVTPIVRTATGRASGNTSSRRTLVARGCLAWVVPGKRSGSTSCRPIFVMSLRRGTAAWRHMGLQMRLAGAADAAQLSLSSFGLLGYVEPVLMVAVALLIGEHIDADEWWTYLPIWCAVLLLVADGVQHACAANRSLPDCHGAE